MPPRHSLPLILITLVLLGGALPAEDRTSYVRSVVVGPGETVDGDVVVFFGMVRVAGRVTGDVVVIGGSAEVQGGVQGDLVVVGGGARLPRGSRVQGDAIAVGGPLVREDGAAVGEEAVSKPYHYMPGQRELFLPGALVLAGVNAVAGLLGLVVLRARRSNRIAETLARRPGSSFLGGAAIILAFSMLFYLGASLGRFTEAVEYALAFLLVGVWAVGYVGLCWALGRRLLGRPGWLAVLAGSLVVSLSYLIPLAGLLAWMVVVALCVGGAALSRFGGVAPQHLAPNT